MGWRRADMMESTLIQAANSMHGKLQGADAQFRGVSTDSRTLTAGELFIALQGPNFDGSRFVGDAARADAAGAVVSRQVDAALPMITVSDTHIALGELAAEWRRSMSAAVIGITGSNGKTTLKEMIAACLSLSAETLATEGNLNNDIGLPLMLLRLESGHRYAVMEMGANHPGEIAYLASLADCQIVVITNAGPAHLEGFGSVEGVARAKGEILESAHRPEVAVLNADDPWYGYWRSKVEDLDVVSFALDNEATASAVDINFGELHTGFTLRLPDGDTSIAMALAGRHNVLNACAAAAVLHALGLPVAQIRRGLETIGPVSGRLERLVAHNGAIVYNDSYNANPVSAIAAAEFLAAQTGAGILVLGDMGELGDDARELHEEVGRAASKAGVARLLATGALCSHAVAAFGDGGQWFANIDDLTDRLRELSSPDCRILVKGSRAMHMERVVDVLLAKTDASEVG